MHWIFAHLIGDYILQNDRMAGLKKQSSFWCFCHVFLYMLPFLVCGFVWWQFLAIAAQHFIQDRTNFVVWFMKAKGSGKFLEPPLGPWSAIVVDNILHILFIAFIASLA